MSILDQSWCILELVWLERICCCEMVGDEMTNDGWC